MNQAQLEALAITLLRRLVAQNHLYPEEINLRDRELLEAVGLMVCRKDEITGFGYFWIPGATLLFKKIRFDLMIEYELWLGSVA